MTRISSLNHKGGWMDAVRREHFEVLCQTHVPRFLFSAWSKYNKIDPASIYNTTEIVPAAYIAGTARYFFSQTESELYRKVWRYLENKKSPPEFSTWTASLLTVLCYAEIMDKEGALDVHVAVLDRRNLAHKVLVWHVPDLVGSSRDTEHEYLAHGCIRGAGYKTVSYRELKIFGLDRIFPERSRTAALFSDTMKAEMWEMRSRDIEVEEMEAIKRIADLFGYLAGPVTIALMTLRPRIWFKRNMAPKDVEAIIMALGDRKIAPEWASEDWLRDQGMIYTKGYPDVRQWVDTLRCICQWMITNKWVEKKALESKEKQKEKKKEKGRRKMWCKTRCKTWCKMSCLRCFR